MIHMDVVPGSRNKHVEFPAKSFICSLKTCFPSAISKCIYSGGEIYSSTGGEEELIQAESVFFPA